MFPLYHLSHERADSERRSTAVVYAGGGIARSRASKVKNILPTGRPLTLTSRLVVITRSPGATHRRGATQPGRAQT